MSGSAKRKLYAVVSVMLVLVALAGSFVMWWFAEASMWYVVVAFVAAFLLVPLQIIFHELGHVFFGLCAGMKFVLVKIGYFFFDKTGDKIRVGFTPDIAGAGESAFFPRFEGNIASRVLCTTLGGAVFNLLYALVFFLLYFLLPYHPALLFFALFAPVNVAEALCALIPIELSAGKTDGKVALGLLCDASEEDIMLRVLTAQAIVYKRTFTEIPRGTLFETPIVREDLPEWIALLTLRMQYLLYAELTGEAEEIYRKLCELSEYLPEEQWEEIAAYGEAIGGEFAPREKSMFYGIRMLDEKLLANNEKICHEADFENT